MPIKDKEAWQSYVDINRSDYGKACVDVARRVMELLDEMGEEYCFVASDLICQADKEALGDNSGITGYMASAVAHMVSVCHSRGDLFRESWNVENGASRGLKGTVNPSVFTIGEK